jgi:hypothetical protein
MKHPFLALLLVSPGARGEMAYAVNRNERSQNDEPLFGFFCQTNGVSRMFSTVAFVCPHSADNETIEIASIRTPRALTSKSR